MITSIFLGSIVMFLTLVFSVFPHVEVLPTIANVNLDTVIVGGIGNLLALADVFWYITVVIQGFLFITGYYALLMIAKFLAGVFQAWGGQALN